MEKLALVKGIKNEATGTFAAPNKDNFHSKDLAAIASDDKPTHVEVPGYAGQNFAQGQLYVGNFDTDADQFVKGSDLVPVPAFVMPGNATPQNVKVNNGGVDAK